MATLWASQEDFANEYPDIEKSDLYKYKYQLRDCSLINNNGSTKSWIHIYQPDIDVEVYYMDYWDSENLTGGTQIPLKNDQVPEYDGEHYYRRITEIVNMQGPTAYNEHGAYAIYGGQNQEINFGVRLDGTLFSKRGSIGGWRIQAGQLVNYVNDIPVNNVWNDNEGIALDSENHQIRLHGSDIVLDGTNGVIFMGKVEVSNVVDDQGNNHKVYSYNTNSHLVMSNINITATTVGATRYGTSTAGSTSILTVDASESSTIGSNWSYDNASQTISYGTDQSAIDPGTASTTSIRGQTTIHTIELQAGTITDTDIEYDRGFYTICYNQSDILDIPSYGPAINGEGGLGIAFSSYSTPAP